MSSITETHYFSDASNTAINNLNITTVNGNMHTAADAGGRGRHGLSLLLENISTGAFHDAAERADPPKCHPQTRVAIRAEIMGWVDAPGARDKLIIWMYGPAGSGKTAIAQSIAEAYKRAVSFFFSLGAAERNDTTRVVATIAYQISLHLPQIQDHLFTAIERDQTIFSRVLATQMQVLVVEPLKALPPLPQPIFVILDGLDEAGSRSDRANLLNAIGTATEDLRHIPLIFLIASRPEYEIRTAFSGRQLSLLSHSLILDNSYKPDDDIRLYLTSTFEEIRDRHVQQGAHLPSAWPSKTDIDHLVSKASGQFIFAATVLRFIDSIRHDPRERLDIIFGLSAPGNETPFALLDALYHRILSSAEEPAKVLQILTMLLLNNHNTFTLLVEDIEELLDLDVRRVLVDMHALVFLPPSGEYGQLRFHHASLSDFLMDRFRSRDFYIDASQGHIDLTRCFWKLIFNDHYFERLSWLFCFENFVYHLSKSPAGVGLIDDLACLDLKQVLKQESASHILLSLPWKTFFECIEKQGGDREDISRRMKAEFDAFVLDCLSKYPPTLQTYIPTILALGSIQMSDIFHILLCSSTESITECDNICDLDSTLLRLATSVYVDDAVSALFKDKYRAGEYYVSDGRYLALAHRIIGTIFPKPGENNRQVKFAKDFYSINPNEPVLYLEEGSVHLRLLDSQFFWFRHILREMPLDLDLATMLRERALQYNGHDTTIKYRYWINRSSLKYIQRCGIPYLDHVHPPGTNECFICEECEGASVIADLDWQNDPQSDAAAFISSLSLEAPSCAGEVGDHRNDLNEEHTVVPIGAYTGPGFGISSPLRTYRESILGILFKFGGITSC